MVVTNDHVLGGQGWAPCGPGQLQNGVSEQHSGDVAKCPSDYVKNIADLEAGLSQGPGRDFGSGRDRSPYPNTPPKGSSLSTDRTLHLEVAPGL